MKYQAEWIVGCGMLLSILISGCSGRAARIRPPKLSPTEIAAEAIGQLDKNGNGRIELQEAAANPAIAAAFPRCDTSPPDKALTAEEIAGRLQRMLDTRLGMMPCYCEVTLDGQPLVDAKVKLIPEPLLGDGLSEAEGTTSDSGEARPMMVGAEPGTPGVQFGWYRVEITHPTINIPARYNSATTLGMEISPLERESDHAAFKLTSKP